MDSKVMHRISIKAPVKDHQLSDHLRNDRRDYSSVHLVNNDHSTVSNDHSTVNNDHLTVSSDPMDN